MFVLEWLVVRFTDDNILYKCQCNEKNIKIGKFTNIEWLDGFKYKAKIIQKGSKSYYKFNNIKQFLNFI